MPGVDCVGLKDNKDYREVELRVKQNIVWLTVISTVVFFKRCDDVAG